MAVGRSQVGGAVPEHVGPRRDSASAYRQLEKCAAGAPIRGGADSPRTSGTLGRPTDWAPAFGSAKPERPSAAHRRRRFFRRPAEAPRTDMLRHSRVGHQTETSNPYSRSLPPYLDFRCPNGNPQRFEPPAGAFLGFQWQVAGPWRLGSSVPGSWPLGASEVTRPQRSSASRRTRSRVWCRTGIPAGTAGPRCG